MSNTSQTTNGGLPLQVIDKPQGYLSAFSGSAAFAEAQRMANLLSQSALVPDTFRGKIPDCVIALELAGRIGASPLAVMQNLYIVHGKPAWSSQFLIACVNACGRFTPLRYVVAGEGDDRGCIAWAKDNSGERLESPKVTIRMAKEEGWFGKNGSKWKTMPDLMLRYRAATLFARTYAPELTMGIHCEDEIIDIGPVVTETRMPVFEVAAPKDETETPKAETAGAKGETLAPSMQTALGDFLTSAGVAFEDFRGWIVSTARAVGAEAWADWQAVPDGICEALKADPKGLGKCITLYGKKEEAKL